MIEHRKSPAVEAWHSQGNPIGHLDFDRTTEECAPIQLRLVVENHFLGAQSASWEYLYAVGTATYDSEPVFSDTLDEWQPRLPDNECIGLESVPAGGVE